MKAAQEAAKAAKAPVKERKIIFFHSYLKASVVKLVLFLIYLATSQDFSNLNFSEAHLQVVPIHFNLFCLPKAVKRIFITIGYFTTSLPLGKPLHSTTKIYNYLIDKPSN
jgi:hypothetical protein